MQTRSSPADFISAGHVAALAGRADRGVERRRDGGAGERRCGGGCRARARRGSSARARHDPSRRSLRSFLRHAAGALCLRATRRAAPLRQHAMPSTAPRRPHASIPARRTARRAPRRPGPATRGRARLRAPPSARAPAAPLAIQCALDHATIRTIRRRRPVRAETMPRSLSSRSVGHTRRPRIIRYDFCDYLLRADAADAAAIFDHFGTVCAAP